MPKPTLVDILSALNYDGHWAQQDNASRVMALIDAWEAEMKAEPATTAPEDWERFNELQRVRRAAYDEALAEEAAYGVPQERARVAARRYPLKKRVAKVIPDPHYPSSAKGEWRACAARGDGHAAFEFHSLDAGWIQAHKVGIYWTQARVRALAALLEDPWAWEDSTEIEDA